MTMNSCSLDSILLAQLSHTMTTAAKKIAQKYFLFLVKRSEAVVSIKLYLMIFCWYVVLIKTTFYAQIGFISALAIKPNT